MAKSKVTKESADVNQVVIQELNIVSANRSQKDIGDVKSAILSAESVYYPNQTSLFDLYSDVILDGTVTGVIDKRIESVLNKNLYFVDSSGQRIHEMEKVIESAEFRGVVKLLMESQAWGVSGMEFIPGTKLKFNEIPRKHIKKDKKIISYEQNDNTSGISYDGVQNLWIVGDEKDLGYLMKCSPYVVYKRGTLGDYAQYIEIFGQPIRVIYYDAYDTKTRHELRKVLDESGSSLAMMIPKQAQFEIKDGKASNADGDLQLKFLNYMDEEITIIVLGNTETTRSSSSSGYAQSKEHSKQQDNKTKSDLKFVKNLLNSEQFIAILKSYGYPVVDGHFVFENEIDLASLKTKAEMLKVIKETNPDIPIDDDWTYKTFSIEKPKDYDDKKVRLARAQSTRQNRNENKKNLSAWDNLRAHIADFFDQAR